MKKIFLLFISVISFNGYSQIDFSNNWEDFFSYNNVKDFVKSNDKIYAIVDNAMFVLDLNTNETKKVSSINGLSGEVTSAIYFDQNTNNIVIGYENGLIEVIDQNQNIHISSDIERLTITGSKKINHITSYNNKLYISTAFALIEYDIQNYEFGDTFFIGNQSSIVNINKTVVLNDVIYAATEFGVYTANVTNPNLIDFNNWEQPSGNLIGNFTAITKFNNKIYATKNSTLYEINLPNLTTIQFNYPNNIINLSSNNEFLTVTTIVDAYSYSINLVLMNQTSTTSEFDFELNQSITSNNIIYLATNDFGILSKPFNSTLFEEHHPEGPLFNSAFSIEVVNNNLWVVYGGTTGAYNSLFTNKGFSHFNGENWINTPFSQGVLYRDLVDVSIDPSHENRVFISSFLNGMIEIVDDEIVQHYNQNNSGLELRTVDLSRLIVSGSVFDNQGDLWVANGWTDNKIKKYDTNNNWTGYNIEDAIIGTNTGLGEITIDNLGNKWLASRDYGAIVFNENGDLKKSLTSDINHGNLPEDKVRTIVADRNNRIWIGTDKGFVVFSGIGSIFEAENYQAQPVLIQLEGATGEEQAQIVLGEQPINSIAIDGADNKWFGTNAGVLGTNPSARETLHLFTKENSPLPSNQILKIRVDDSTGKVYFATTQGIVAFNNNVAPFGDTLGETYAFPNPSTSSNEFVTIDGRKGKHLPRGTNVKILDSAGYLVHETNVVEGSEIKGGKVTWDKTNLAGRKVASGVYIVLLTLPDKSETSITKIAIIK